MSVNIQKNLNLAPHTVYKIGGPARFFAEVKSAEDFVEALRFAKGKEMPFLVLGAGSNMLVSDKGFPGLVMHLSLGGVEVKNDLLKAGAGIMMARAVAESAKAGLAGFEWGIGVPGTIGGSVRGNAGCFGYELKDIVESVEIFDTESFERRIIPVEDCEFSYRDSIFKSKPNWIILCATFKLRKDDSSKIQETIKKISAQRTEKQDIGAKSCGCIFKNVAWNRKDVNKNALLERFPELNQFKDRENIPSSFLIDASGLKGKRIGHVFISPKHANFFINDGNATAEEVIMLIGLAKDAVKTKFGILLEEEIQYVGF